MSPRGFSCDACGHPAGLHDRRCSRCGRSFEAVRCPKCGHQGPPGQFTDGCPSCRYLAAPPPPVRSRRSVFGPAMAVLGFLLAAAVAWAWVLRQS